MPPDRADGSRATEPTSGAGGAGGAGAAAGGRVHDRLRREPPTGDGNGNARRAHTNHPHHPHANHPHHRAPPPAEADAADDLPPPQRPPLAVRLVEAVLRPAIRPAAHLLVALVHLAGLAFFLAFVLNPLVAWLVGGGALAALVFVYAAPAAFTHVLYRRLHIRFGRPIPVMIPLSHRHSVLAKPRSILHAAALLLLMGAAIGALEHGTVVSTLYPHFDRPRAAIRRLGGSSSSAPAADVDDNARGSDEVGAASSSPAVMASAAVLDEVQSAYTLLEPYCLPTAHPRPVRLAALVRLSFAGQALDFFVHMFQRPKKRGLAKTARTESGSIGDPLLRLVAQDARRQQEECGRGSGGIGVPWLRDEDEAPHCWLAHPATTAVTTTTSANEYEEEDRDDAPRSHHVYASLPQPAASVAEAYGVLFQRPAAGGGTTHAWLVVLAIEILLVVLVGSLQSAWSLLGWQGDAESRRLLAGPAAVVLALCVFWDLFQWSSAEGLRLPPTAVASDAGAVPREAVLRAAHILGLSPPLSIDPIMTVVRHVAAAVRYGFLASLFIEVCTPLPALLWGPTHGLVPYRPLEAPTRQQKDGGWLGGVRTAALRGLCAVTKAALLYAPPLAPLLLSQVYLPAFFSLQGQWDGSSTSSTRHSGRILLAAVHPDLQPSAARFALWLFFVSVFGTMTHLRFGRTHTYIIAGDTLDVARVLVVMRRRGLGQILDDILRSSQRRTATNNNSSANNTSTNSAHSNNSSNNTHTNANQTGTSIRARGEWYEALRAMVESLEKHDDQQRASSWWVRRGFAQIAAQLQRTPALPNIVIWARTVTPVLAPTSSNATGSIRSGDHHAAGRAGFGKSCPICLEDVFPGTASASASPTAMFPSSSSIHRSSAAASRPFSPSSSSTCSSAFPTTFPTTFPPAASADVLAVGRCRHHVHKACMLPWVLESEHCPMCRSKCVVDLKGMLDVVNGPKIDATEAVSIGIFFQLVDYCREMHEEAFERPSHEQSSSSASSASASRGVDVRYGPHAHHRPRTAAPALAALADTIRPTVRPLPDDGDDGDGGHRTALPPHPPLGSRTSDGSTEGSRYVSRRVTSTGHVTEEEMHDDSAVLLSWRSSVFGALTVHPDSLPAWSGAVDASGRVHHPGRHSRLLSDPVASVVANRGAWRGDWDGSTGAGVLAVGHTAASAARQGQGLQRRRRGKRERMEADNGTSYVEARAESAPSLQHATVQPNATRHSTSTSMSTTIATHPNDAMNTSSNDKSTHRRRRTEEDEKTTSTNTNKEGADAEQYPFVRRKVSFRQLQRWRRQGRRGGRGRGGGGGQDRNAP